MKINIMTLFPEMFEPIRSSMIGRAADNGIIELNIVNIRDYTEDKHCRVDDTPFGGGAGMLMQVQPIISCYRQNEFAGRTIYMSPRGRKLSQETAEELAGEGENDPYRMVRQLRRRVARFVEQKWRRKPMIIPTVVPMSSDPVQADDDDIKGTRPSL